MVIGSSGSMWRIAADVLLGRQASHSEGTSGQGSASQDLRLQAWHWALANRAADGLLPSGREIARQYGRRERRGRLVKRAGAAGELGDAPGEPALRLVESAAPATRE